MALVALSHADEHAQFVLAVWALVLLAALPMSDALADPGTQTDAVRGLIGRVVPERASLFQLEFLNASAPGIDVWEVETVGAHVVLRGTSGVALASAFNWYLKYRCNSVYLWQEQQVSIPTPAPVVSPKKRQTSTVPYRYYYNVCTFGYSSAFWHWSRWEREIDWMAMNGINFPLAFVGQEYLWERLFASLGMNQSAVRTSWFSNAAFLPWNRMGNLNSWAGPLAENFIEAQVLLQKQLLQRQRAFGMRPILPGFAGHVPPAFVTQFPHANVSKLVWTPEFGPTYFLDPMDPLFHTLGTRWIAEQTALFGTDHFYNADPFNEMNPGSNDTHYLATVSNAIYRSMSDADPNAIWILQGWFLLDDWWAPAQTQSFLDAVPDANLIVLDLWAEVVPYWKGHKNFYGKQFIWCMLHDFGGRSGLYATFDAVNSGVADAMQNASSNLVGIGLTPEAIETNPIIYDFMMEFTWNGGPRDVGQWVRDWATRRYGVSNGAAQNYWLALRYDILNCPTEQMAATATPIVMHPSLYIPSAVGCCASTAVYYNPHTLDKAWTTLLSAAGTLGVGAGRDTYLNDVVEITRQVLGDYSFIAYQQLIAAWNTSNTAAFARAAPAFLQIFQDMDTILASRAPYLLGVWVNRAELWGVSSSDANALRRGALLQVTSWGPPEPGNGLHEYAFKLWSGLVGPYYGARWSLFLSYLNSTTPARYSHDTFMKQLYAFESAWVNDTTTQYATVPVGDTLAISQRLRATYSTIDWRLMPHARGAVEPRSDSPVAQNVFRRKFRASARRA